MDMDLIRLEQLAAAFHDAKVTEEFARVRRIVVEKEIAGLISTGDTSSRTITLQSGRKITVKRGLIYKADLVEVSRLCSESSMAPPIKTKTTRELDAKGYEWYRKIHPTFFSHLAKYVTITPRKVAVTLQEPKGE